MEEAINDRHRSGVNRSWLLVVIGFTFAISAIILQLAPGALTAIATDEDLNLIAWILSGLSLGLTLRGALDLRWWQKYQQQSLDALKKVEEVAEALCHVQVTLPRAEFSDEALSKVRASETRRVLLHELTMALHFNDDQVKKLRVLRRPLVETSLIAYAVALGNKRW